MIYAHMIMIYDQYDTWYIIWSLRNKPIVMGIVVAVIAVVVVELVVVVEVVGGAACHGNGGNWLAGCDRKISSSAGLPIDNCPIANYPATNVFFPGWLRNSILDSAFLS